MAEDWDALQQDISADLIEEGMKFSFSRPVPADFDPIESVYQDVQELQFSAHGIFCSVGASTPSAKFSLEFRLNTSIEIGDKVLLLDCSTYNPEIGDYVELNGERWLIKGIAALEPGGVALLRYVVIHRG